MEQTEIGRFIALKRKDENNLSKNVILSILYSLTLLIGIMVCPICNSAVFSHIGKTSKAAAFGITFLIFIPFLLAVNIALSKMMGAPVIDVWDLLSVFILFILAFLSFTCGFAKKKGMIK